MNFNNPSKKMLACSPALLTQNWKVALKLFGMLVIIPKKMTIETPLPIPRTVIWSAIQSIRKLPANITSGINK
jgi:hypothetical protein